jgi:hypothetical protein
VQRRRWAVVCVLIVSVLKIAARVTGLTNRSFESLKVSGWEVSLQVASSWTAPVCSSWSFESSLQNLSVLERSIVVRLLGGRIRGGELGQDSGSQPSGFASNVSGFFLSESSAHP